MEATNQGGLTVKIENKRLVALTDLTQSLNCFADEYSRFIERQGDEGEKGQELQLYVREIRSGSIIADLMAAAPYSLPLIEHVSTIVGYAKHLKILIEFLLGKSDKSPEGMGKVNFQNISNIVEPIAKDNGAMLVIGTVNVAENSTVNINLNSTEANAVQNAARREIASLKEPELGNHDKVLLHWYQARNDPDSKSGDKALIESIHSNAVKTIFANDELKAKMLSTDPNPFKLAFVVDVAVETIGGKPALYKVLNMHEWFDKPTAA